MRMILRAALLLTVTTAFFGAAVPEVLAQRAVEVDRVVAVVKDEVITAVEVRNRVQSTTRQLEQQGIQVPPHEVLERQLLERLILERVQMQRAEEIGLRVDDVTLERAIERIAQNNNLTEDQLREALDRDGISWERFRQEIRTEILLTRLREREVESQIVVTDAEIDNFIANNPDAFSGEELLVAHVLIRVPEAPSEAELNRYAQRAEQVVQRHRAGEDFGQLAAEFSDAPDAVNGGVIGWRGRDSLPALFAEAVRSLRPGEVSPVMRSAAGLHVVKLVGMRGSELSGADELEQTRARHILIRTSEVLSDAEVESRLNGLRERVVRGGESFEDLAKVHSDDLSAARGGDLGWVFRGDTVPEFERAMDELEPGEVSEPVRSPFGWHLIQVVERRVQDVSDERVRNAARNAMRERKIDEAFDNWLRELRDSTYVEYRIERD